MEGKKVFNSALDYYNCKIEPKLKEIDIFLKIEKIHTIENTAKILEIEESEVLELSKKLNIKEIDNKNFILLMKNGSSFICKLLKREVICGSPKLYTPSQISYIYELDYNKVLEAFNFLSLEKVSSKEIKLILAQIIKKD